MSDTQMSDTQTSDRKTMRWIVRGRVQGVFYRAFTRQTARHLGLPGWAKNLPDGTVEVRVSGTSEELDRLRNRLSQGPRAARVAGIDEHELTDPEPLPEVFEVRH